MAVAMVIWSLLLLHKSYNNTLEAGSKTEKFVLGLIIYGFVF